MSVAVALTRPLHALRPLRPLALVAALCLMHPLAWSQAAAPAAAAATAASGPTVSPEAAKPLAAAQQALRDGKYTDALARLAEAEALPKLSPYEAYVLRRIKSAATFGAGDLAKALPMFEALIDDPQLPAGERASMTETTIKVALQAKDYVRAGSWMKRYIDGGGQDAEIRRLYPQVLSLNGDHAGAAAGFKAAVTAEEAAGRIPAEASLRLLASSQSQSNDDAGYLVSLQKLATTTGKADYWSELIARTARQDGFAGERLRLDIYRLRQAVGMTLSAGELGDMAFRANQAGLPAEAQKLLDDGFERKVLGLDANAEADRKLREQATKSAMQERAGLAEAESGLRSAKDGQAAYGLGLAMSGAGQHEKALTLIAQGLAKGGLKRPDDALLHQGIAQWRAGQIDAAAKTFAAVGGSDGTADLARLWLAYLKSPARK